MISVFLSNFDDLENDEKVAKEYISNAFTANRIDLATNIQDADDVVLMFNPLTGFTSSFMSNLAELVEENINPIYLVINSQTSAYTEETHRKYLELLDSISPVSYGYPRNHALFYFDNDNLVAYTIEPENEKGVDELIEYINMRE